MTRDEALAGLQAAIATGDEQQIRAAYRQLAAEHEQTAQELLLHCAVTIDLKD